MADVGQTLPEATKAAEAQAYVQQNRAKSQGATRGARKKEEAPGPGQPTGGSRKAAESPGDTSAWVPPALPTQKTRWGAGLEEKTVLLYGPHGIGKSTLAAEWAGGEVFFFDTAGELNDIECYSQRVTSWAEFKAYCAALELSAGQFKAAAVDTVDMLGLYCAQHVRKRLGIVHESDAEWGKGWQMVREEFATTIAKLATLPGLGLILVSHSKEVEIKTRSATYDRQVPTLVGGIKEVCVNLPDLVLHVNWSEQDERVFHTKPSPYWEAKERGQEPRLAAELKWPLGKSGYATLKEAWDGGK